MTTISVEKNPGEEWDNFVYHHPQGTIYHTSGWKRVIESSFKHISGQIITIRNDQNKIIAGLPIYFVVSRLTGKRIVSAPFALYCDPLTSNKENGLQLLKFLQRIYMERNFDYFEIRFSIWSNLLTANDANYVSNNVMHVLRLNRQPEDLRKIVKQDTKQSIAKGKKINLVMKTCDEKDGLNLFYKILLMSRKHLGLPPIPFQFFNYLWEVFKTKNQLELVFAFYNGRAIASKLFLKYKDTFFSEYSGDITTYRKLCANHFLEWESIKLARSQNYKYYNFGRTACNNKGLLFYKSRWGTEEKPLYYLFCPAAKSNRGKREQGFCYNIARKFFRKSPLFISQALGHLLYNHMG